MAEKSEVTEGEETLPVFDADAKVPGDSEAAVSADAKEAEKAADTSLTGNEAQADGAAQDNTMDLTASTAEIMVGQKATLTATITLTASTEESFDRAAAAAAGSLSWETDGSGAAAITQTSEAQIVKESAGAQQSGTESDPAEDPSAQETVVYRGTVSQTVTVTGSKEGTASVTAAAGEEKRSAQINVKSVPAVLGQAANIYWRDTTVLTWDKVKNAGRYRVVVSVYEGKKSYAGVITVTSNSCDVEDKIVGLIRTYKSSLTGASYSVRATVQAISTDPVHYKSGAPAAAPGFRYLNTTDNPDQKSERR